MAQLGPYGAHPRLGVAVSGGADSTALALLAQGWAAQNQGTIRAFIVDHGLRPESAAQAALTAGRLQIRGIASEILTLSGLSGPAIQEKARIARYDALATAAMQSGYLHLLLGHHAADQAETVTMRLARGPHGAEGIAPWSARNKILLLRPLLTIQPQELRAYLAATNTEWIEDPSNQNPKFERVRIRQAGTTAQPAAPALAKGASLKLQPSSRATPVSAPKALRCSTRRPHRLPHLQPSSAPWGVRAIRRVGTHSQPLPPSSAPPHSAACASSPPAASAVAGCSSASPLPSPPRSQPAPARSGTIALCFQAPPRPIRSLARSALMLENSKTTTICPQRSCAPCRACGTRHGDITFPVPRRGLRPPPRSHPTHSSVDGNLFVLIWEIGAE